MPTLLDVADCVGVDAWLADCVELVVVEGDGLGSWVPVVVQL